MQWILDNLELILGGLAVLILIGRFLAPLTATKIDDFIVDALDAVLKMARGRVAAGKEAPLTHEERMADRKIELPVEGTPKAKLKAALDKKITDGLDKDKP